VKHAAQGADCVQIPSIPPGAGAAKAEPSLPSNRAHRIVPVAKEPERGRLALNVPQAAWLLGVSPNFVWSLIAKGELGSFTLGRKRMVARSEIERFIAAGGTNGDRT
jgi:excisionase family DNA binding protein